ncbi:hypothetical protein HK107_01805 [Parvularcula sp. ZS-1/3]|uniref:Transcriptional regulator MraZ n=1 Tax=Parvularcula mediterranea TaxID=2732508 RepID=A0A7Y3RJ59_9PROT|nr:hypothetical protein [Parvularcula mediterranea]NNU15058.1 hypothetical protein [Parvularcula mediterranea]
MATVEGQVTERGDLRAAARFTGRFPGKLDTKSRVVIPTEFRQQLVAPEVYAFPSLTEDVLQLGTAEMLADLLEAIAGQDVYDEDRWLIEEEITAGVLRLAIDETGRVSLPKNLREHAKLSGPVGFAGRGRHFILADAAWLEARRLKARQAAGRHAETLRARSLPSVQSGRKS